MADDSSTNTSDNATCKVCCAPINPQAKKCTKCDSFQDWTRHLLRLGVVVGGFLALTPLWNISKSLTVLATPQHKSARIQAAVTGCTSDEVRVVFENSGQLSGIITGVHFALQRDGVKSTPEVQIRRSDGEEDIVVTPQQPPVRASYRAYIDGVPASFLAESGDRECRYLLVFNGVDLSGNPQQIERSCLCP